MPPRVEGCKPQTVSTLDVTRFRAILSCEPRRYHACPVLGSASLAQLTLARGVIGNTADSGSAILGSSPSGPASLGHCLATVYVVLIRRHSGQCQQECPSRWWQFPKSGIRGRFRILPNIGSHRHSDDLMSYALRLHDRHLRWRNSGASQVDVLVKVVGVLLSLFLLLWGVGFFCLGVAMMIDGWNAENNVAAEPDAASESSFGSGVAMTGVGVVIFICGVIAPILADSVAAKIRRAQQRDRVGPSPRA